MSFSLRHLSFFVFGCLLALAPVVGVNWLIGQQGARAADAHLEQQAAIALDNAASALAAVQSDLARIAEASDRCSLPHLDTLRQITMGNPFVGMAATRGPDGVILCVAPDIGTAAIELFHAPVPLAQPGLSVAQMRLADRPVAGLLFIRQDEQLDHAIFVPQAALDKLFTNTDPSTGIVLSLGEQVIMARDAATAAGPGLSQLEMRAAPLEGGAMRVQVAIDRALVASNSAQLQRWATLGALVVGGFVVLLVGRLVHATPKQLNEIERAIENDEFIPYFQPTFDVTSGKLLGCEVLVRWQKPDGTIVSPGAFIALAEQSGLAVPITRNIMRATVKGLGEAYGVRPELKVAINLFNQHFDTLDIVEDVRAIVGPSLIAYEQLVLEVTERAPLASMEQAKLVIGELHKLGCRLALDDAGTGHGGLAYLQELGLDIVKIDKMFIDQLGKNRAGETITHALTELARELNMGIVAEGVETVEQVAHLKRFGIREAQGYLFAPPLPLARFLALVEKLAPPADPARVLARGLADRAERGGDAGEDAAAA